MPTIINTQSIITVPQIETIATDGSSTIYVNEDKQQLRQIPVNKFLDSIKQKLCDTIYPIGAIYMSTNPTSPADLFGGTWEAIEGRFLVGANRTYTAGSTGGSADAVVVSHKHTGPLHKHTVDSHFHDIDEHSHDIGNHTHSVSLTSGNASQGHTHSFSGSQVHNHAFSSGGVALTVGSVKNTWANGENKGIGAADNKGWWYKENKATGSISNSTVTISGTTGGQSQSHTHSVSGNTGNTVSGRTGETGLVTQGSGTLTTNDSGAASTGTTGESGTGKNLPPYVAVYMWKRIS